LPWPLVQAQFSRLVEVEIAINIAALVKTTVDPVVRKGFFLGYFVEQL
jgi:hypothetical protein